jgi:hypothetical protein
LKLARAIERAKPEIRLCNECASFATFPFTVGKCRRRLDANGMYPMITAERAWPDASLNRCGPDGRYFRRAHGTEA